jgi:hypothetical protein
MILSCLRLWGDCGGVHSQVDAALVGLQRCFFLLETRITEDDGSEAENQLVLYYGGPGGGPGDRSRVGLGHRVTPIPPPSYVE